MEKQAMGMASEYAAAKPTAVVEPSRGLFQLNLEAVWQYRELLYFMVWRDVKIRYKSDSHRSLLGDPPATDEHGALHSGLWR